MWQYLPKLSSASSTYGMLRPILVFSGSDNVKCFWLNRFHHNHTTFGAHIDHSIYMSARHMSVDLYFLFMVYWFCLIYVFFMLWSVSIAIQSRFTIFGRHIDYRGYMWAIYVSLDNDLIFMVYWLLNLCQVFMIMSLSPLPYKQ